MDLNFAREEDFTLEARGRFGKFRGGRGSRSGGHRKSGFLKKMFRGGAEAAPSAPDAGAEQQQPVARDFSGLNALD
jgi:hypothetical protein